jgi:putative ABC transport system permease protein
MFRREQGERDFAEELESHLQLHIEDNLSAGMSPGQARRAALLKLGGVARTKEDYRDRSGLPVLETLAQDVRYGLRQIKRSPGYAVVAVLTLALGIGANTAIFSVVNAVVLRELPYPQPDRLMVASLVNVHDPALPYSYGVADYLAAREGQRSFKDFAAVTWADTITYTGGAEPERLHGTRVSAEFFTALGVHPALGRAFAPGEDAPGHTREVVLSHRFWQQRFGADPAVIGRALSLDGESFSVVGVLPADFHFDAFGATDNGDVWPLMRIAPRNVRYPFGLRTIGRLKPGITLAQARTDLSAIARDMQRRFPNSDLSGASIQPLKTQIVGSVRPALLILLAAVGLVLLIATVNVANLAVSRTTTRDRELAIRAALGASRGRVARQVLTESVLVAAFGGTLGLFLAYWGVRAIVTLAPGGLPRLTAIAVDGQVLAFTMAVSLLSGLLFGLAPAVHGFGRHIEETLRGGAQNLAEQRGRRGLRHALVVVEVSLSLVLLIGAGLLLKSFERLTNTSPGFNPKPLATALISLPRARYQDEKRIVSFYGELLDRVQHSPGVRSASISMSLPPDLLNMRNPFWVPNEPIVPGNSLPSAVETTVSPGYLQTLGVPLLRGRWFEESDRGRSDQILVINDALARRYFRGQDPIGQRIKTGDPNPDSPWETIVGVVADIKYEGLDGAPEPTLYVPYFQAYWPSFSREMFLVARTSGDPKAIASSLRTAMLALDRDLPPAEVHTMKELLADSVAQPRFRTLLLGIFAGMALLLSAVGIFGVMAYLVSRRTQEIGVRMALGASRGEVRRMILGEGLRVTLIGIAIGLVGAFASGRLIKGLLYGVGPADPATFAGVSLLVIVVALIACYLPAHRATQVDPMIALRYE